MLVLKEENIENSTVYQSFKLLKKMRNMKGQDIPIYEISKLCNGCGIIKHEQIIHVLCFLYSLDLIYFKEPNICLK